MKKNNPKVVFIDDHPNELAPVFAQFEAAQIDITILKNTIDVAEFIDSGKRVDVFIVDVMLYDQSSLFSTEATQGGLITGLLVGKYIRERGLKVPIVFYSQASFDIVKDQIRQFINSLDNVAYIEKYSMDPFDFADTITNFIRTGRVKSRLKQYDYRIE